MEKKKVLKVTCGVCDARNVQESVLSAYDAVSITCDLLLAGPEARELLAKHAVSVVADKVLDLKEDIQFSTVNGTSEIHPGQALPEGKRFLTINGSLRIAPGSGEVLKSYLGIQVNGTVTCPESLVPLLSNGSVNGTIISYPDGCSLLKNTTILDHTFHLRAKQDGHYCAPRRIVALAPDIDFGKLAAKNVRFTTPRLLVAESLAEAAVPLFDDRADITVLPDGCAYVGDDAVLSETLLKKWGGKLYVNGDLTVNQESEPCLSQISFLHVNGDVCVVKPMMEAFQTVDAMYDSLYAVGGTLLQGRASVLVTRELLEAAADGLSMCGCANVVFREDASPDLIRERVVSIRGCASIICNQAQQAVLEPLAEEAAYIGRAPQERSEEENVEDENILTTSITATHYVL